MKRIIQSSIVLAALALATGALATSFTPGNLVIYRLGGNAAGAQAASLTNHGSLVWLDEYTTNGTFVVSHPMPTTYFGANSPVIDNGTSFGSGLITRSTDGRFIVFTGFGSTTNNTFTTSIGSTYGTDAPRVIGLADGNGNFDTTTTITNRYVNTEQERSACTPDGTNIWFAGEGYGGAGVRYTTLGSGDAVNFPTIGNVRQLNIFTSGFLTNLFFSSGSATTNINVITNGVIGTIPTTTNDLSVAGLPGVTTLAQGPWAFALFKLHAGGTDPFDTLYVADDTVFTVWKFALVSGTWNNVGSIQTGGGLGMTAQIRTPIVGSVTNVDLWMTGGGGTLTGGDSLYSATDPSGYNVNPGVAGAFIPLATAANQVSFRGVAFAPVGSESQPPDANLSVGPLLDVFSTASTHCSAPATTTYSVANLSNVAGNPMNWQAASDQSWVSFDQTSGTLGSGGSTTVTVSFNSGAENLPTGTNTAVITFTNLSNGQGTQTRQVTLVMKDQSVSPTTDFHSSGPGSGLGPFSPLSKVYTVYNGSNSINLVISASPSAAWLSFSATNITLAGCQSTNITISINTNAANTLAIGNYTALVAFSNMTAGTMIDSDNAQLGVGGLFFCDDFSTFFQNTALVPQQGWVALGGSANEPWITNNALYVAEITGPAAADEPYKNIPVVSNGNVFAGMVMTVTSAPPLATTSPSRMVTFFNGQNASSYAVDCLSVRDTGSGTFVFCIRNNGITANVYQFSTTPRVYGTSYRVIIQGEAGNTNSWVYVNPVSSTLNTNSADVHMQLVSGSDFRKGSFQIGNTYASAGATQVTPGFFCTKICVSTNFSEIYNDLQPSGVAPTASFNATTPVSGVEPLSVTFTNTSTGTAPITSYWSFGDGASVTNTGLPNVTHTYAASLTPYTVSLTASNATAPTSTATSSGLVSVQTAFQSWQTFYFPGGGPSSLGSADPDGDGVSNTNEFLSGFNPTNSAAYAHVIAIVKSNTDMRVTYLGANGDSLWSPGIASRTNVLEFTIGWGVNGSYTNNFVAVTGGTNIYSGGTGLGTNVTAVDAGGATGATRYYRVRVIAP